MKSSVTPVTRQDRNSADAARRLENQAYSAVPLQLMAQPMLHPRPRHAPPLCCREARAGTLCLVMHVPESFHSVPRML